MASSVLTCPPRLATPRNLDRDTLGPKIVEVARRLGFELMPWQVHALDVRYELDDNGELWYQKSLNTVPRQSGKTTLVVPTLTHRCTRWGRDQNVVYTAQTRHAARKKWEDEHLKILDRSIYARAYSVRKANGSEAILWNNGSIWSIDAPARTSGHGPTLDVGVIDEAFAHKTDGVQGAMQPAMLTRRSAQLDIYSTAGDRDSHFLWRELVAARRAIDDPTSRVCLMEWSAPDDADPGDPRTWWACMPALGYTVTVERIQAIWDEARRKGEKAINTFRRAYLNQWPDPPRLDDEGPGWEVVSAQEWARCIDLVYPIRDRLAFGIDRTPDNQWTTIAVCRDSMFEIVAHRPSIDDGQDWIAGQVKRLLADWASEVVGFGIDPAGPAGSYIPTLAPILGDKLHKLTPRDLQQGSAAFTDSVKSGMLRHRDQKELNDAVSRAVRHETGNAWSFERATAAPSSPLLACIAAKHAYLEGSPASDFWVY